MGCFVSKPSTQHSYADYSATRTNTAATTQGSTNSNPARDRGHGLQDLPQRNSAGTRGASASPLSNRRRATLPGTSTASQAESVKVGGRHYRSIDSVDAAVKTALLATYDPVQSLGLTNDSRFYRVTESKWVSQGSIRGNPKSMASVLHHEAVEPNHHHRPGVEQTEYHYNIAHTVQPFKPAEIPAKDLGHPTLNVMWGSVAAQGALQYAQHGHALVEMTLGDLRRAGGGKVFFDAIRSDDERSIPLIVTLPKGTAVPVKIIDPASLASSDED